MAKQVKSGISAQQIIDAFDNFEATKVSVQTLISDAIKTVPGKQAIGEAATHFVSEGGSQDPRLMVLRQQVQRADNALTVSKDKASEDGRYIVTAKREDTNPRTSTKKLIKPADLANDDLLKLLAEVRNEMHKRGLQEPNTTHSNDALSRKLKQAA